MRVATIACIAIGTSLSIFGLSGCATPYQEMGFTGGVSGNRITKNTFQIVAQGNAYTDMATIQRYVLRRASELTLAAGYDYFVIDDPTDQSSTSQVNSNVVGLHHGRAYGFGLSQNLFKPGEAVLIKGYHGPVPDPAPMGVYDAHEIQQYMGAQNVGVSITGKSTDASSDHKTCTQVAGAVKCN